MQNGKVSRDLNPPIDSKFSHDNLDSIGGFKSCDTLPFCIQSLVEASNLKNMVNFAYCKNWRCRRSGNEAMHAGRLLVYM